eukprot:NODE_13294_length_246_cov_30.047120.p5 GENE.NODE_13294_length_246_cov_30.047120~~NODE_13294_length_246_cov_30.047120.p5  ORF type:complete len:54 (+),score=26.65 NODE_13294_length_246_cov_30.047120:3-164(+)
MGMPAEEPSRQSDGKIFFAELHDYFLRADDSDDSLHAQSPPPPPPPPLLPTLA